MTITVSNTALQESPAFDSTSIASLTARLMIAPIFLLSGIGKITAPATYLGYIEAFGLPQPWLALSSAITIEIAGGLALVAGYRLRLAALGLAIFSIATALIFHSDLSNQNEFIQFWKNAAIAGGLFSLFASGAGRISLDARLN